MGIKGPHTAIFGGIKFSRGFNFCFTRGITPSVCNIYTVPHTAGLASVGDLLFGTLGGAQFKLTDCLLEEPSLSFTIQGAFWRLPIMDRRWRWRPPLGPIWGHYNCRRPDLTYLREKSTKELVELCLKALGEKRYDLSRMPDDPHSRPEVHWDGCCAAPEMDSLLKAENCVVCLNPLTDTIEIWPCGQGIQSADELPDDGREGGAFAPVRPATPRRIIALAAPTMFQGHWHTEPVGMDVDGQWKHIDQLSYRPPGGWSNLAPAGGFVEITGTYQIDGGPKLRIRDLARSTVNRCFRVTKLVAPLSANAFDAFVPAGMSIDDTDDLGFRFPRSRKDIKFYSCLADQMLSHGGDPVEDDAIKPRPMRAYVKWYEWGKPLRYGHDLYPRGFSFDTEHGIITFSDAIFQVSKTADQKSGSGAILVAGTTKVIPADVIIECGFNAGSNGVFDCRSVHQDMGTDWTTPPHLIKRDDVRGVSIARTVYTLINSGPVPIEVTNTTQEDNSQDVTERLRYWLSAATKEFVEQPGATVVYDHLENDPSITPDGNIEQVVWEAGGGKDAKTTVSVAHRYNRWKPSLEDQRLSQATESLLTVDRHGPTYTPAQPMQYFANTQR